MFTGGVWITTITPFDDNGNIDETSLRRLADFYIKSGVHGISLGVLGEVSKLSEFEKNRVTEILVDQTNGRVPVNIVCTTQSTKKTVSAAKEVEELGAQTVMIAPPSNVNNDEVLYNHYAEIAENISIPIIVQDDPITTNSKITPELIVKMANEIENIQYVKLEDVPTTIKISEILEYTNKLKIIGGGAMFFYEELTRGAVGTMSSFPFPQVLVNIYNLFSNNNKNSARDYFYEKLPLIRYEEVLLPSILDCAIITKEVFKMMGVIESSHLRMPASSVDRGTLNELTELIEYVGLKV